MEKQKRHTKRKARVRGKIVGTAKRPRLSVHRTNVHFYAQLIDDEKGVTILSGSDTSEMKGTKSERSEKLGEEIAKSAKAKKIEEVIFDRGGFRYHGRVKAFAEGARKGGLKF